MSIDKIYDIGSDHLKCNFCVKYFKCSMHYANIQRYSLKACPQCFDHFCYKVVHPINYKIYKVMLVDMGIKLPLTSNNVLMNINHNKLQVHQERSPESQRLWQQFIKTQQQINNNITTYFEDQIKKIIDLLQKTRSDFQKNCLQIKSKFEVNTLNPNELQQLSNKIEALKSFNYDNQKEFLQQIKYHGVKQLKESIIINQSKAKGSTRKLSYHQPNKQNFHFDRNNKPLAAKSIKDKILGSININKKSSSKESRIIQPLLTSRSTNNLNTSSIQALVKSKNIPQPQNPIDKIKLKTFNNNQHDIQRNQINKLLSQKSEFDSYMKTQFKKDEQFMIKNESYRNMSESILELRQKTIKSGQLIEIIGQDMSKINFDCYLRSLGNVSSVKILRIIRCSLVDADMNYLLHFLSKNQFIQTLIVTNNRLSQNSIQALLTFKERHKQSRLKNIYMGNNHINYFKANQIIKNNNMDLLVYI